MAFRWLPIAATSFQVAFRRLLFLQLHALIMSDAIGAAYGSVKMWDTNLVLIPMLVMLQTTLNFAVLSSHIIACIYNTNLHNVGRQKTVAYGHLPLH